VARSGPSFYTRLGRHIAPQIISPVVVAFSLDVGAKILAAAELS
jgi:ABC-type dipeptide/oligopeptide/nickel transport system permease subunit